jgi:DNA repair protein RecN (Recombination protein N)
VIKTVNCERTLTSVAELDENGRIEELGRMISGADGITAESMEYGSSLLNAASALKTKQN